MLKHFDLLILQKNKNVGDAEFLNNLLLSLLTLQNETFPVYALVKGSFTLRVCGSRYFRLTACPGRYIIYASELSRV